MVQSCGHGDFTQRTAADAGQIEPRLPVSRFDIIAHADPQTLIRMLNYFALLGLVPRCVDAVEADGLVTIRIEQPDLGEQQAHVIAEKMRSSVLALSVGLHRGRQTLLPLDGTNDDLA